MSWSALSVLSERLMSVNFSGRASCPGSETPSAEGKSEGSPISCKSCSASSMASSASSSSETSAAASALTSATVDSAATSRSFSFTSSSFSTSFALASAVLLFLRGFTSASGAAATSSLATTGAGASAGLAAPCFLFLFFDARSGFDMLCAWVDYSQMVTRAKSRRPAEFGWQIFEQKN